MGILSSLFRPRAAEQTPPPPTDPFWYTDLSAGGQSSAGVTVTPDSALRVAAVFACVRLLASTVASLPLNVYERLDRGKRKATEHPLHLTLASRPNTWQTAFEWKQMMTGHVVMRGNAYSRIVPGPRGAIDQLVPLHPDRVEVLRLSNGRLGYEVSRPGSSQKDRYGQDEVLHLRDFSTDGIKGLSRITLAREAIGSSLAAQTYGSSLWRNGARPAGAIKVPAGAKFSQRAIENLRVSWHDLHGGPHNAGRPAILEEGLEWENIGLTNEDAQWVESMKLSRSDVAMIFGVPPHMIGDTDKSTSWGSGIEEQGIGFITYTLDPWLTLWEQACGRDLLADPETFFVKFLLLKLLRGDVGRRYAAYAIGRQWGWLSVNDVRELEDMNPITNGDEYLQPLNMVPVGQQVQTQAEPDEEPEDPKEEDAGAADAGAAGRQGLRVLLADAAERCAAAEVRGLEKRAAHAGGNPERFATWLVDYYQQHTTYLVRVLQPIADAWALQGGPRVDVAALAERLRQSALEDLQDDPAGTLGVWQTDRTVMLLVDFEEAFHA